ncbi:MAG: hypothetical protein LBP33_01430 [Candidatus Adiutrix sp.]|nr:hypothetical protein [Candidatus Adiutrix sp.]
MHLESFVKRLQMDPEHPKVGGARLWVAQSSSVRPGESITMRIDCQPHDLSLNVGFCFSIKTINGVEGLSSYFETGKNGLLSYRIDEASAVEENWFYMGMLRDNSVYQGTLFAAVTPKFEEQKKKSTLLLQQMEGVKIFTVQIKLENGLEAQSFFDLMDFDAGLEQLNKVCYRISTQLAYEQ